METDSASPEWDWDDPDQLSGIMDDFLIDLARCEKLEPVALPMPFTRDGLAGIGVTGLEFAAWKTAHPNGLGTDLVCVRAGADVSKPGQLYSVDNECHFIGLDIREPLPIETGAVDWVYAEHLIEHVTVPVAVGWLTEVRRILAPGGLLRLTTPDLSRYVESYLRDNSFFRTHRRRIRLAGVGPPMPTRKAFMINQLFYLYGHRWIYDLDELRYVLSRAGFDPEAVRAVGFREGARQDVAELDRAMRSDETVYVEVTA